MSYFRNVAAGLTGACAIATLAAVAPGAQAAVLDFSGPACVGNAACASGVQISSAYGDVPGALDVRYDSDFASSAVNDPLSFWDTGYGDLSGVAYGGDGPEIFLKPLNGQSIRLLGFDLAAFGSGRTSHIKVLSGAGVELASIPSFGFGAHNSYSFNLASADGIRIRWGSDRSNVGIDNIEFELFARTGGVPEPATWAMMILGFGAVGAAIRRRQPAVA